jgi:hypothetical protein
MNKQDMCKKCIEEEYRQKVGMYDLCDSMLRILEVHKTFYVDGFCSNPLKEKDCYYTLEQEIIKDE